MVNATVIFHLDYLKVYLMFLLISIASTFTHQAEIHIDYLLLILLWNRLTCLSIISFALKMSERIDL